MPLSRVAVDIGKEVKVAQDPFEGALKLNLGCGKSLMLNYINVDWDRQLIASLQLPPSTCFVCADSRRLPFKDALFDVVYSSHLFEHFEFYEAPEILDEWKRVLKRGGLLAITVPNAKWFWRLFLESEDPEVLAQHFYANDRVYGYKGFRHRMMYTAKSLSKLLERCGFKVVAAIGDEAPAVSVRGLKV